jgi:hypothetical protein
MIDAFGELEYRNEPFAAEQLALRLDGQRRFPAWLRQLEEVARQPVVSKTGMFIIGNSGGDHDVAKLKYMQVCPQARACVDGCTTGIRSPCCVAVKHRVSCQTMHTCQPRISCLAGLRRSLCSSTRSRTRWWTLPVSPVWRQPCAIRCVGVRTVDIKRPATNRTCAPQAHTAMFLPGAMTVDTDTLQAAFASVMDTSPNVVWCKEASTGVDPSNRCVPGEDQRIQNINPQNLSVT